MTNDLLRRFGWIPAVCDDTAYFARSNGFCETAKILEQAKDMFFKELSIGYKGRAFSETGEPIDNLMSPVLVDKQGNSAGRQQTNIVELKNAFQRGR